MRRITCSQIEPWLEPYVDHELEPWMIAIVQAHLSECANCSGVVRELRAINQAVRDWVLADVPQTDCAAEDALALAKMLRGQVAAGGETKTARTRGGLFGATVKRLGLTPGAAGRALVTGAAFSGRVLLHGARLAAGAILPATPRMAAREDTGRNRPPLAARTLTTAGRYAARAALAGARWLGREALALG